MEHVTVYVFELLALQAAGRIRGSRYQFKKTPAEKTKWSIERVSRVPAHSSGDRLGVGCRVYEWPMRRQNVEVVDRPMASC